MESQMQLRDPEVFPSEMELKRVLGEPVYSVLASFFEAIAALDISEEKKDEFAAMKLIGKLIPMTLNVSEQEQLDELLTVVRFKKSLK